MSEPNYRRGFGKRSARPDPEKNKKIKVDNFEVTPCYGYEGFRLYFAEKDPENVEEILTKTKAFESYIHRHIQDFPLDKIKELLCFNVDLKRLLKEDAFNSEWPDFKEELADKTESCRQIMGLAMHQVVVKHFEEENREAGYNLCPYIWSRFSNHEPILQVKQLRVSSYGKLVAVQGTVIKASARKLLALTLAFKCPTCTGIQVISQKDGLYTPPIKCPSVGCRAASNFIPMLSSPNTQTVACQSIKLQELVGDDQGGIGRVPKTIECELTEDLVGYCQPGQDVTVTGVIKVRNTTENFNKSKQPSVFLLYLDGISIKNDKDNSGPGTHTGINFNQRDYEAVEKIQAEPNLFRLLVQSLCPHIYGHEVVKAGLILALFGGTSADKRSDSHLLMVGDPGLGKSQLLQACCNVAPRGVYVCGNTSTVSGLTATMTKESGGDYSLEAGALILADQGCCCIDEFDKMSSQHSCLLEAMEQQSISITKAGVQRNLPARTCILAAANPVGGHYNKAKTVAENLKMGSPLLSRFDLVFILLDQPDEQRDMLLSEHVLSLHIGRKRSTSSASSVASSGSILPEFKLKDRLTLLPGETVDIVPHVLLRKYIAYAQKYVHPILNREAQKILLDFYVNLRKQYHKGDSTPVTARQLESLIRLTQARAKLELREEATAEDAVEVVDIMRHSLIDIFTDQFGALDFTRSQNGCGVSNRKLTSTFLKALKRKSQAAATSTFHLDELKDLSSQLGIPKESFAGIIDSINIQGYLLKKPDNKFQFCATDF